MKYISILLILLLFLTVRATEPIKASEGPGILDNVASAIRNNDSRELARYFNTTLEVSLFDKEGTYSRVQAEMIVKNFFIKYPSSSFIIDRQGSSAGGSQFLIGSYKTGNKVFRTYVFLKPVSGQLLIQQLQFEDD